MRGSIKTFFALSLTASLLITWTTLQAPANADQQEAQKPTDEQAIPELVRMLPGYTHEKMQGFDSELGRIVAEDGLTIDYEIGRVIPPGQPRIGGSFIDRTQRVPADQLESSYQQTLGKHTANVALLKTGKLLVAFPESGINFSTQINSPDEAIQAMLIMLTHPTME